MDYGRVIFPAIELNRGDADPKQRKWFEAQDLNNPRGDEAMYSPLRIFLWAVFERYEGKWHLAQIELTKESDPDFTPIGLVLPDFTLTKLTNEKSFRPRHWRGKRAMVLNFWHENTHALTEQLAFIRALTFEKHSLWNVLGAVAQCFALASFATACVRWSAGPLPMLMVAVLLQIMALTFFFQGK